MYNLGERRVLSIKSEENKVSVVLKDDTKSIEIPAKRWATFVLLSNTIELSVQKLRDNTDYVKLFYHFGGGWYISVTTGFKCVDLRRFYKSKDGDVKPTREGLALRLAEWSELIKLTSKIHDENPVLAAALPCFCEDDHNYLQCRECCPFEKIE